MHCSPVDPHIRLSLQQVVMPPPKLKKKCIYFVKLSSTPMPSINIHNQVQRVDRKKKQRYVTDTHRSSAGS